jgi:hypothetical protein
MNYYLATSSILFLLLFAIWQKKDWPNFFLKVLFCSLFLWGLVLLGLNLGFLVRK